MASVLKIGQTREVAAILRDLREASAENARFEKRRHVLDDDALTAWDRLDDRIIALRAELDALVLDRLGVGLDQIKEAIGC